MCLVSPLFDRKVLRQPTMGQNISFFGGVRAFVGRRGMFGWRKAWQGVVFEYGSTPSRVAKDK